MTSFERLYRLHSTKLDSTSAPTAHTDFAEVEADTQQVNLTRFSLFFPEQREFFLEAANSFTFGTLPRRSAESEGGLGEFARQPPLALGHPDEVRLRAPVGAVFLFNGATWHATGLNETDEARVCLICSCCRSF